ncbi:MAG: hypothetical protein JNL92_19185 [Opitutaceae bacterium]|nr:hypothetical protein [Opitutaceae bacterium]
MSLRPLRYVFPCAALLLGPLCLCAPARAEVQIDRIFMPHQASPSSFAVGLPGGVNFCWDPLRGAVSYAWKGGFLDPTPARPGVGKFIEAAKLLGPLVYQESGAAPLRRDDPAREPTVEFTGYTLKADAIEFRYLVNGIPVREEIRARPDGGTLVRRLQIEGGSDSRWWHVVAGRPAAELKRDPAGAFVLELPLSAGPVEKR